MNVIKTKNADKGLSDNVVYSVLSDNKNLFASKYLLYLPKEEELKLLIETDRQLFELALQAENEEK